MRSNILVRLNKLDVPDVKALSFSFAKEAGGENVFIPDDVVKSADDGGEVGISSVRFIL